MQKIYTGNTVELEEIKLLSVKSTKPKISQKSSLAVLNSLCNKKDDDLNKEKELHEQNISQFIEDEQEELHTETGNDLFVAADLVDFLKNISSLESIEIEMIIYIAGFIAFSLRSKIKCSQCLETLTGKTVKSSFLASKIATKKLEIPSDAIVLACTKAEHALKCGLGTETENFNRESFDRLTAYVISAFDEHPDIFVHINEAAHGPLLLDIVVQRYLKIRFVYLSKKQSEKVSKRQYHTKMIQFIESTGTNDTRAPKRGKRKCKEEAKEVKIIYFIKSKLLK